MHFSRHPREQHDHVPARILHPEPGRGAARIGENHRPFGDFRLRAVDGGHGAAHRSEEHTSELQSPCNLVCRLLLEKKKKQRIQLLPYTLHEELLHIITTSVSLMLLL